MFSFEYHAIDKSTGFDIKGTCEFSSLQEVLDVLNHILAVANGPQLQDSSDVSSSEMPIHRPVLEASNSSSTGSKHDQLSSPVKPSTETRASTANQGQVKLTGEVMTEIARQVRRLGAKTNYMKATVIVAVLTAKGNATSIDLETIEEAWQATGVPMPENLPRDTRNAAENKGWLVEGPKEHFQLSESMEFLLTQPDEYLSQFYRKRKK